MNDHGPSVWSNRRRQLLHALRQAHGVALRRVVHTQIVTDPPDDHLARVEAQPEGEVDARIDARLVRVLPQPVAQVERRVTRPLGVILVRDRRAAGATEAVSRGVLAPARVTAHCGGTFRDGSALPSSASSVFAAMRSRVPAPSVNQA